MATQSIPEGYKLVPDTQESVKVPQARGKAAAFDRWLAQGGKPFQHSGKFKQGPMKGLTYDQAKQKFETMWATSPDSIKEKYASRAGDQTALAPSERTAQGIGTPVPKQAAGTLAADQQKSRMAYYTRINGVQPAPKDSGKPGSSAIVQGPPAPRKGDERETMAQRAATPAEETGEYAPGSDQARAAALSATSANERLATADNGDGAMRAAVANQRFSDYGIAAVNEATKKEAARRAQQDQVEQAVPKSKLGMDVAQNTPTSGASPAEMKQDDEARVAAMTTPKPTIAPAPTPTVVQSVGTSQAATPTAPAAKPSTIGKPAPINSLTGLPMGYRPGDAVAPAQQAAADASVAAQKSAPPITAGAPRAIPVVTPTPPPSTVAMRAADEMRRQAAINANPATTNPDDPKKFFTGRVLPLDQLVKPKKLQGIGIPSRA